MNNTEYEIILSKLMGVDRSYFVIHEPSEEIKKKADVLMERWMKGEPLAYIFSEWDFYGKTFTVTPDTLIPRPETEIMVDLINEYRPKSLLEIGTGSGCVAISAKLMNPKMRVVATDISKGALSVAKKNARKYKAAVEFLEGDLLSKKIKSQLKKMELRPEMVVANLPYVDKEWDWIDKKALSFEPECALFATNHGLDLIYRLINEMYDMSGRLILEADPSQHEKIIDYGMANGLTYEKTSGFQLVFRKD